VLPKGERIFATPIAKRLALERGIPLAQVKGTGPEGRITREDVEKFKPGAGASAAATSAPAAPGADYEDVSVSNMRRTIGQRLTQSKQELPHYYVTVDVTMDKVLKLRSVFNKALSEKEGGAKLSVNDFIVKAASLALADVPEANSAWLGDKIRT
jgi:pyruvate dehydrogenase E2 component (dihydrolipoamide acetyltransferase)